MLKEEDQIPLERGKEKVRDIVLKKVYG